MILSTGVIRAIARSHPTITLDVLASPANAAVLEGADYVAQVIVFDRRRLTSYASTIRRLRRARYDAVIDCMVTSPSLTTLLLMLASGARHRIGIAGRGNDAAFDVTVPAAPRTDAHMIERIGALAAAFDVSCASVDCAPVLTLSAEEQGRGEAAWRRAPGDGRRVLINVSAGMRNRLWPDERYVAVMRHLRAREPGSRLLVIAAPNEGARAAAIAHDGGGVHVPTPTLRDVFALVASADLVFTPDTSVSHAATALKRPCITMYIAGTITDWGLYGTRGVLVDHPEPTLESLSAERMIDAVEEMLTTSANGVC